MNEIMTSPSQQNRKRGWQLLESPIDSPELNQKKIRGDQQLIKKAQRLSISKSSFQQLAAQSVEEIKSLNVQLQNAFPYNKNGNKDDYSFLRVEPHLNRLIDQLRLCLNQCKNLNQREDQEFVDFIHFLQRSADELPEFENEQNNFGQSALKNDIQNYLNQLENQSGENF